MSIDPKTLPKGTVVKTSGGTLRYLNGIYNPTTAGHQILAAFVPVPDGMTVEDATQALADHVQWVPLPDGPTKAHVDKRVRINYAGGGSVTGIVHALYGTDDVTLRWMPKQWSRTGGEWFIHPDDVPTSPDPDAELIEAIARGLNAATERHDFDAQPASIRDQFLKDAAVALAVVREHEAGAR